MDAEVIALLVVPIAHPIHVWKWALGRHLYFPTVTVKVKWIKDKDPPPPKKKNKTKKNNKDWGSDNFRMGAERI
jgi:hypothetical protein